MRKPDETTDIAIWSTIEVGVGITTLSVAALHPLVTQWRCRRGLHPAATAAGAAAAFPSDMPLSPSRNHYWRTHSNDPPGHHARAPQRQSGSPLKLRPDDTVLYISSASGPSSSPPPAPPRAPSRFALCHWIEEGGGRGDRQNLGGGGHGDGIGSFYHQHHRDNDAGWTTELADWRGDGGDHTGGRFGITKTTEVEQQSLRRPSRIDTVLMTNKETS